MKVIITITCTIILLANMVAYSQSIVPFGLISHANYYASPSGVTLHTSLGEITTAFLSSDETHLSQGFLQVFNDLVPTKNKPEYDFSIGIAPNPFTDFITIEKKLDITLEASVFDMNGHLLIKSAIIDKQTTIDTGSLSAGSYFLRIYEDQYKAFHTIKIIKI